MADELLSRNGPVGVLPVGWWRRLRPILLEGLLMLAVAAAIDLRISASAHADDQRTAVGYLFGPLIAIGLPLRRERPLLALGYPLVVLFVYHAADNPGISPALALAVPVHYAAYAGRMWWAVAASGLAVVVATGVSLAEDRGTVEYLLTQRILEAALLAVLVLLAETRRMRALEARRSSRESERLAREKEVEARQGLAEQRVQIARELHDVLAHTLAAATVQAAVAADTMDDDPVTSRGAIEAVRQACREARSELAAAVGLLRADEAIGRPSTDTRLGPVAGLGKLEHLLAQARRSGLDVSLRREGAAVSLPPAVDLTAYRVIQEALTNVVRHSAAGSAEVVLTFTRESLGLSVHDSGPPAPRLGEVGKSGPGGYGLLGMRERVSAIGGELAAASDGSGGFQATARLPLAPDVAVTS